MTAPLRILAAADIWFGSNGDAYVRAFRRLGHSVRVLPVEGFLATDWRSRSLRALRRMMLPALLAEYNAALVRASREFQPDLLFVYKGRNVREQTVRRIRAGGAVAVNIYPDVSLLAHGREIPRALPAYDWVFHTKKYGIADLDRLLNVRHASVLSHAFDPDVHRPMELSERDRAEYACDVSFIGTWSPKKQALLEQAVAALPGVNIRIWGGLWEPARHTLGRQIQGRAVTGSEYAKAVVASRINLAILSEARRGSSSGDQITSRTFHMPATGAFMLHERTSELLEVFTENVHCGAFDGPEEMVAAIRRFLAADELRTRIAAEGRRHVVAAHSMDERAKAVVERARQLREEREPCR